MPVVYRTWLLVAIAAAVVVVLAALPSVLKPYPLALGTQILIYGIFAMSLNLLVGYTGLPSLGHASYFGVAAYTVAILTTKYAVTFWGCLAAAVVLASALSAVFGLLALRARGVYFLMITLALSMVVWGLVYRWAALTNGDNGIAGITAPDLGLPWSFADRKNFYYLSLVAFLAVFALILLIVRSPFGKSLQGIRESEDRMASLGYHVWLHMYLAFIMAGALAGIAGTLWSYYNSFVSPYEVGFVNSVEALLMVVLGGPGTVVGPVLGAALLVFVKNFVALYTQRWLLVIGGIYIMLVLLRPSGIVGAPLAAQKRQRGPGKDGT
jgi:branched-chain amino acid transport system permease protein